jgi:hypothetical protein
VVLPDDVPPLFPVVVPPLLPELLAGGLFRPVFTLPPPPPPEQAAKARRQNDDARRKAVFARTMTIPIHILVQGHGIPSPYPAGNLMKIVQPASNPWVF